jgi:hypothetical protein
VLPAEVEVQKRLSSSETSHLSERGHCQCLKFFSGFQMILSRDDPEISDSGLKHWRQSVLLLKNEKFSLLSVHENYLS